MVPGTPASFPETSGELRDTVWHCWRMYGLDCRFDGGALHLEFSANSMPTDQTRALTDAKGHDCLNPCTNC